MTQDVVKATAATQPITYSEMLQVSKMFYESGMFADVKSAAQAMVKVSAGAEFGIPPFAAMSGIHIIQGKPTIGSGLMAARVKGSGKYDYKVVEHTEKICSIDFYKGKEKLGNSTFTIDDAKKAGTKNLDKFPKNMLFARAMSNGVKFYTPDIYSGPVYVPEEMEAVTEDAVAEVVIDETSIVDTILQSESKEELTKLWKSLPKEARANENIIKASQQRAAELSSETTSRSL